MNASPLIEIRSRIKEFAKKYLDGDAVCVALSGGADSLALTAGACAAGLSVRAIIIDHRLQHDSADVAAAAAENAERLGAVPTIVGVDVRGHGGLESAARAARYAALAESRQERPVLIGHTLDDQAETVLLGLARGSGPRSIAGMRPWSEPWGRPLLGTRRAVTEAACAELGLTWHHDRHNSDPRFTRVRIRSEVLPVLEEVCQGGVADALARTAAMLREDIDLLETMAAQSMIDDDASIDALTRLHPAIRRRVLREWIGRWSAESAWVVIDAVDRLITDWHGQGPIAVGGDGKTRISVVRRSGRLSIVREQR